MEKKTKKNMILRGAFKRGTPAKTGWKPGKTKKQPKTR